MTDGGSLLQRSPHVLIPRPPVGWDAGLVAAKLSRPEVPPDYVDRLRLHDALDLATQSPVTVVTGGPGWGKTLLVASWAARAGRTRPVAWLTVDVDDEPPVLLDLRAGRSARDRRRPPGEPAGNAGPGGRVEPRRPPPDPARALTAVPGGRPRHRRHVGGEQRRGSRPDRPPVPARVTATHRACDPPRATGVAAPAAGPRGPGRDRCRPAGLHRRRGEGAPAPTGPPDRSRRSDAPARSHRRVGRRPAPRTMFLRRPGAGPWTSEASDRAVADYLLGEVVAGQSPQTWQFLLRTSLVPHICGELADTLTGQTQGQLTLDLLERDSGFVTALGPERRWYRYHPLLGEMLQRQLELERPDSIRELHERAAGWFATNEQADRRGETCRRSAQLDAGGDLAHERRGASPADGRPACAGSRSSPRSRLSSSARTAELQAVRSRPAHGRGPLRRDGAASGRGALPPRRRARCRGPVDQSRVVVVRMRTRSGCRPRPAPSTQRGPVRCTPWTSTGRP